MEEHACEFVLIRNPQRETRGSFDFMRISSGNWEQTLSSVFSGNSDRIFAESEMISEALFLGSGMSQIMVRDFKALSLNPFYERELTDGN